MSALGDYIVRHILAPELSIRSEVPPEQPPQGSGVLPPPREKNPATVQSALTIPALYRSVQAIGSSVSNLSLDVYDRHGQPKSTPFWLSRPDIKVSRSEWLQTIATSLATRGNAYLRVVRKDDSDPTSTINAVLVLDPTLCFVDENGRIFYNGGERPLPRHNVLHLKFLAFPGQVYGLGPIQACISAISGILDTRAYADEFFDTSGVPSGVIQTPERLNPETAKGFKEAWDNVPAGQTRILGGGAEYKSTLISPKEAQFLEAQEFSVRDIARLFGLPASLLLANTEGSSLTYTNIQDASLEYIKHTLAAYLRPIEEALSTLLPRGQEIRFNYDALLRASTSQRYAAHQVALTAGFLTVDEVRAIENLPPLPEQEEPEAPKKEVSEDE